MASFRIGVLVRISKGAKMSESKHVGTLTKHQKFTIAEAIGRYDVQPTEVTAAIEGHVTLLLLGEVRAFARQVAFNLRYVDPMDYNRRWNDRAFLLTEPEADDEICYRVRQLIGRKVSQKIVSWREVINPYADPIAA
jgi:hypothetical protein